MSLNLLPLRLWTSIETHSSTTGVHVSCAHAVCAAVGSSTSSPHRGLIISIQGHLVTSSSPSSLRASLHTETTRQSYSRFCPIDHTHRILASQRRSSPPLIHTITVLQPTRPEPLSKPAVLIQSTIDQHHHSSESPQSHLRPSQPDHSQSYIAVSA